jgi:hypothetical protein
VLVRNKANESDLSGKHNPHYTGPMVFVRCNQGNAIVLAELDGSLSKLRYSAARIIPYAVRKRITVDISHLINISTADLDSQEQENKEEIGFEYSDDEDDA